jgi:hypothetical protein
MSGTVPVMGNLSVPQGHVLVDEGVREALNYKDLTYGRTEINLRRATTLVAQGLPHLMKPTTTPVHRR